MLGMLFILGERGVYIDMSLQVALLAYQQRVHRNWNMSDRSFSLQAKVLSPPDRHPSPSIMVFNRRGSCSFFRDRRKSGVKVLFGKRVCSFFAIEDFKYQTTPPCDCRYLEDSIS